MKTHTQLKTLLPIFIVLFLCSCSQKEPYQLPKNAIELLAGESGKTWKIAWRYNDGVRMNMAGCFLSYRITYKPDMTVNDNNGEQDNCGPSLMGNWELITNKKSYLKLNSDQLPEIMNIKDTHKYFKILKITDDTLKLQYRHKQFSSKSTFIDTFVPEHIKVKDRDFHR